MSEAAHSVATLASGMPNEFPAGVSLRDRAPKENLGAEWSRLRVSARSGVSRIVSCMNVQPLKILNPRNLSESSQVYLSSYGGGLVSGDDIRLDIECDPNSKLFLGTQADTKIYKSVDGRLARQHIRAHIAGGSLAVVLPDALIPFAGSRFVQHQEWHLSGSANLLLADWMHSGRTAYGECFDYDFLSSEVRILVDGKTRILDRTRIEPSVDNPRGVGSFGHFRSLVSVYIVGRKLVHALEKARFFDQRTASEPWVVVNPIDDATMIIRVMSTKKAFLSSYMKTISRALASDDLLGFDPLKRKM